MATLHQEKHFEAELAEYLAADGWLYSPDDRGYDRELALFPEDLIGYLNYLHPYRVQLVGCTRRTTKATTASWRSSPKT